MYVAIHLMRIVVDDCLDCGSVGLILDMTDCLVFKSHIIIQWLEIMLM